MTTTRTAAPVPGTICRMAECDCGEIIDDATTDGQWQHQSTSSIFCERMSER
jgi:hypothetical protein